MFVIDEISLQMTKINLATRNLGHLDGGQLVFQKKFGKTEWNMRQFIFLYFSTILFQFVQKSTAMRHDVKSFDFDNLKTLVSIQLQIVLTINILYIYLNTIQTYIMNDLTEIEKYYKKYKAEKHKSNSQPINATYREPIIGKQIKIAEPKSKAREQYRKLGQTFLSAKQSKLAIVLLSGGYGSRAEIRNKEFEMFETNEGDLCLFEKALMQVDKILELREDKDNIQLFVIGNKRNQGLILQRLQRYTNNSKYQNMKIRICHQHEEQILDSKGSQNIFSSIHKNKKIKYPSGIGTIGKAKFFSDQSHSNELENYFLNIFQPHLIYCFGTSNIEETGVDQEIIGLIQKEKLDCVFKVSYPVSSRADLPLVCIREVKGKEQWLVMQYQNLKQITSEPKLNNFPVWMDNFAFSLQVWKNKEIKNDDQITYQFNERVLQSKNEKLPCIVAQLTISYSLMKIKQKCIGYRQEKVGYFLKNSQKIKRLNSYIHSPSKRISKSRSINLQ